MPGVGAVRVAGGRAAGQRVRGGGGDRYTGGQREAAQQDGVLQRDEPGVERDVRVPRAVRRARVCPVRRRGRGHQPPGGTARGAAAGHAPRVSARGHAHHAQPAATADLAVRAHAPHRGRRAPRRARRGRRPCARRPALARPGRRLRRRWRRRRRPLRRPVTAAQDVLRHRVRCFLRELVHHVQGDAGQHGP